MDLFDNEQLLQDIWKGYYVARLNKRNTTNALKFEINLERNIYELYREIAEYRYEISPSICFIVNKPVKREIFAAHFRDRVVHHYIVNQLLPIFENQFIYDCYSCRVGKGTLFGINRLEHFMRSCTHNYTKDAYILKLDLQGFFMSINRNRLLHKVIDLVQRKYFGADKEILLYLLEAVILYDSTVNCKIKGNESDWEGLPHSKSLFYAKKDCGLPIGNLTSQIFANYYLTEFDRYMKETLNLKYYGRYVDDFFVVHPNKNFLIALIPKLRAYLFSTVGVVLHPKKIYLQTCSQGVSYLGYVIKPYGRFVVHRFWRNLNVKLETIRQTDDFDKLYPEEQKRVFSSLQSYLGTQRHANICQKMNERITMVVADLCNGEMLAGCVTSPLIRSYAVHSGS